MANYPELIRSLRRSRPANAAEFTACTGRALSLLGSGWRRETYRIKGTELVVKFPMQFVELPSEAAVCIRHARAEMRIITNILRRKSLRHLRRFVPKVFYFDHKTGVMVVERLFTKPKPSADVQAIIYRMVQDTFNSHRALDIDCNIGRDSRGNYKVIDFGPA